jgi:hypothetical protein
MTVDDLRASLPGDLDDEWTEIARCLLGTKRG